MNIFIAYVCAVGFVFITCVVAVNHLTEQQLQQPYKTNKRQNGQLFSWEWNECIEWK